MYSTKIQLTFTLRADTVRGAQHLAGQTRERRTKQQWLQLRFEEEEEKEEEERVIASQISTKLSVAAAI